MDGEKPLKERLKDMALEELLSSPAGQKLQQAMEVFAGVQRHLYALCNSEDGERLNLLKIGTVFQIFLIDTLASGKKVSEFTQDDWMNIARQVSKYAILEDGQLYSEFVFTMYADYIEISANTLPECVSDERRGAILDLANSIRANLEDLRIGRISETVYIEGCLWISLEAMIKLLAVSTTAVIGPEFSQLLEAVSQLAFEYGRYVLFSKEQAILDEYLQNQRILDDQLRDKYDAFLEELCENAERFQNLIDEAFSPELHNALLQTAELARTAGVREEELLKSMEDIDDFFLA